jgi:DNA uptake protein ComE-like DNA-binding protein
MPAKVTSEKVSPIPTPDSTSASPPTAININKADKDRLIVAFKATGIKQTTIDKLINLRQRKSYIRLESLASDLKFTDAVRKKLQEKLNKAEICF